MATYNGTFSGKSRPHTLRLTVTQSSQDIAANTSVVSWTLQAIKHPSWSSYSFSGNTWSIKINGSTNSGSWTYDFRSTTSVTIASGTKTISHNSDGAKTISVSSSAYGASIGSASNSGSLALTTIPRATQPTVSPASGETGATYTIGHIAASPSFYHDLAYSLDGGVSYALIDSDIPGAFDSSAWTPSHEAFPSSSGGSATIALTTYASLGGAHLGTKTVVVPLSVPSSVKPTVSSASWAEGQTASPDLPTLMGGAGRFVQRWSKLIPTLTTGGAGGSSVVSTQVTQNAHVTSSGVAFTNAVTLSGSAAFTATATDTRGRVSETFMGTVAVKPYNYPSLPTPLVSRTSDAGGTTPDPTGTYLAITPAASVSSLNFGDGEKNLLEWRVRTKPSGGSYTTIQDWTASTVSGNTWTTKYVAAGPYLANTEYVVEVSIRDLFGKEGYASASTVKTLEINVPSEAVFMDWNGVAGLGVGGYHRGGVLDVHGEARADTFLQDGNIVVDETWTASDAAVIAGVEASTFVTPAGLALLTSTEARRGLVELATEAETRAGTDTERAVTPAGLAARTVSLFSGEAAGGVAVTLSQPITDFTTLTIHYRDNDFWRDSSEVYVPDVTVSTSSASATKHMLSMVGGGTAGVLKRRIVHFYSDTSLRDYRGPEYAAINGYLYVSASNQIVITRVIGHY